MCAFLNIFCRLILLFQLPVKYIRKQEFLIQPGTFSTSFVAYQCCSDGQFPILFVQVLNYTVFDYLQLLLLLSPVVQNNSEYSIQCVIPYWFP